jgi:hypothetical protein
MRTDRPTRETMSLDEATVSNKIRKVTLLQDIYFQCNFRLFTAKEADSTKPFGSAAHKQSSQCRTIRRDPNIPLVFFISVIPLWLYAYEFQIVRCCEFAILEFFGIIFTSRFFIEMVSQPAKHNLEFV